MLAVASPASLFQPRPIPEMETTRLMPHFRMASAAGLVKSAYASSTLFSYSSEKEAEWLRRALRAPFSETSAH